MAYIVQADLAARVDNALLSQLFSDGSGAVSASLVSDAIGDAEADVDSILGPSFEVPFASATRIIKRCACDFAVFYGYERKPEFLASSGDNPVQKRYDRAKQMLKDIKSGARDLGNETAEKSAAVGGVSYAPDLGNRFILDDVESGPF